MSKDLEMLKGKLGHINKTPLEEALDRLYECNDDDYTLGYQQHDYKLLQQALLELKAIKESKPSEVLECLEDIYRNGVFISCYDASGKQYPTNISPETNKSISEQCETIKQTLLKAREQEKVLGIIIDREVSIQSFRRKNYKDYEDYCNRSSIYENSTPLTKEEFDLLKRYFK